jgi:myo-inositol-1(or 4)-monophosphatase
MAHRSALVTVMARAAEKAARGLLRDFGEVEQLQVSRKGPSDFVSNADRDSERIIRDELSRARPKYGLIMEESSAVVGEDTSHNWVIDPLDGTTNFLHGIPHFSVSIALEENREYVAGVVYDPAKDELFWAERGQGAYMNNRRIRVSGRRQLSESLFGTGTPFKGVGDPDGFVKQIAPIMRETAGVRRLGSAALDLAYVAAGRFEGYWESGLHPWDIAAGIVLVREAGGFVTDERGGNRFDKSSMIIAANPHIHGPLKDMVAPGGAEGRRDKPA